MAFINRENGEVISSGMISTSVINDIHSELIAVTDSNNLFVIFRISTSSSLSQLGTIKSDFTGFNNYYVTTMNGRPQHVAIDE